MICCPDCATPMRTWDDPIYDPQPTRFRTLGMCEEKLCQSYGHIYHVVTRGEEYEFRPPYTNRGVTSPIGTPVKRVST